MKLLIVCVLLMFSLSAHALETVCIPNNAGGMIHLSLDQKMRVLSISSEGTFEKGTWEQFGKTKVLITWDTGSQIIVDTSEMSVCEL
jgi:hypothetical protein